MDEFTADAFANRDETVALVNASYDDVEDTSSDAETTSSRSQKLKRSLSPSGLRERVKELHDEKTQSSSGERMSIQDRLFTK